MKLKDTEVESEGCDYGALCDDGYVIACDDIDQAREMARLTGTKLVARDVYTTAWAEVETP